MKTAFNVPFFELKMGDAAIGLVTDTIRAGWLGQGRRTREFETAFAKHENVDHAIATNSCTAALHASVAALGAGPGDGVLIPTHTWVSTAEAVANEGATPIFVDCLHDTQQIDLKDAARKIEMAAAGGIPSAPGQKLRVVGMIPVYYSGLIPDETVLRAFADLTGLWWITDAAHAFTSSSRGTDGNWVPCGAGLADVYCYSFYPNKPMTTGDGGMAVTRHAHLAERIRRICNHGLSFDTWSGEALQNWDKRVIERGYKYTMTDVDASIGLVQLATADQMRDRRAEVAATYDAALGNSNLIGRITEPEDRRSSRHLYPIQTGDRGGPARDDAIRAMRDLGVDCRVHWRPLHLQPYFADLGWGPDHCPTSSTTWTGLISLPMFHAITDEQVDHVINVASKVVGDLSHVS